jgi:CheY-like chemotaxis protein
MNLVGNAIKFTESGEVALHATVKSQTETEVCLHFTVADTGIGIAPGKQELIFEAFIQGDSSTTRHYGGTGLGLAICSELIELMGGIIWVESELGQGSRFHFTVRFGLQKNPAPKISLEHLHLKDLSVLVADDNATNRRVLEELLNQWEMKPIAVESGEAALAAIQEGLATQAPFALALLDAAMPQMDGFMLAEEIKKNPQFLGGVVMMLSSAAQLEDAGRCRSLGIPAYLTKPVKQSELLDAILTALGKAPACSRRISPDLSSFATKHRKALRILLAEDNQVNQRLARRLLEKWGHTVVVAANGKKALTAWESEVFDLILMDVQMPEMSGLETTAAIRERERTTGKHLPIIAMTAHALKGDRERCLAAGMDAYVTKPIDPKKLSAAIEIQIDSAAAVPSTPTNVVSREPGFDSNAVLERVGGDRELLREVALLFFEDTPVLLAEIRAAIDRNDPPALERSAHRLKGSVSNFGAKLAQEAALRLELMGRQGDVSNASERYQELERELAAVTSAIESLLSKEAA